MAHFSREKMLRLEHENKMLKLQNSGESSEQADVLQTMLDDANARKNELETDLRSVDIMSTLFLTH